MVLVTVPMFSLSTAIIHNNYIIYNDFSVSSCLIICVHNNTSIVILVHHGINAILFHN